jgi:PAS domain S-box-containing protein
MLDRSQLNPRRPRGAVAGSGHTDAGEAKFRTLLEAAPDAIVLADERGRVVLVNARVEQMFGYRREELLGQPVELLVPDRLRARHASHQAHYHATPETRPMGSGLELRARRKDGSEFPAEISLSPLSLDDGRLLVTAIIRDTTERHAREDERRKLTEERAARAAAEAANRAKDEFLAAVSHELRAPLNAMLGWAALVHENPGNADILARAIPAIERNAQLQRRLVDDLLDDARIAAGTMRVERACVDLGAVLVAAVDAIRPAAEAKGVALETATNPVMSGFPGDANRLQQVFLNLVTNAVKFTPAGGSVHVRSRRTATEIVVVVEDTGQGVSEELLPHVFERFQQGHRPSTPSVSGLGLGLAIAKDLVERHGGTIVAESEGPGRGSRFTVRLPVPAGDRGGE